jgi:hypothetical protein
VPNQALRQQSRAKAVLRILMSADQGVLGKQLHHPFPLMGYEWDINGILQHPKLWKSVPKML